MGNIFNQQITLGIQARVNKNMGCITVSSTKSTVKSSTWMLDRGYDTYESVT